MTSNLSPIAVGLIGVLHIVLDVPQFVMDGQKVVEIHLGAHFNAEIASVAEIPRRRMADDLTAVAGLFQHRQIVERVRQRFEPHGFEKVVAHFKHPTDGVVLLQHGRSWIDGRLGLIRLSNAAQTGPESPPHIAQKVGR